MMMMMMMMMMTTTTTTICFHAGHLNWIILGFFEGHNCSEHLFPCLCVVWFELGKGDCWQQFQSKDGCPDGSNQCVCQRRQHSTPDDGIIDYNGKVLFSFFTPFCCSTCGSLRLAQVLSIVQTLIRKCSVGQER